MKQCPKCNANICDTAKFCPMCGCNIKKYEEENNKKNKMFCSECGAELEKGTMFCPECGNEVNSFEQVQNSDIFNDDFLSNIDSSTSQKIEEKEIEELFSQFEYEKHMNGTYTIIGLKDKNALQYTIPEGVVSIASHAFEGSNSISITLPNSLILIGDYAFKDCIYLEKINLPKSLRFIGEEAFLNCSLLEIEIPNNIRIGKDAIKNTLTNKKEKNDIRVGNVIKLGDFYIDNSNTRDHIEWLILEKREDKALLISKYGIDCKQYHKTYEEVTWEKCDLREWLNNEFLNTAFTNSEQNKILNTRIHTNDNSEYGTSGGNDTIDKIFLLSIEEAKKYFSSSEKRKCQPTKYAKANGVFTFKNGNCYWWLRSPGTHQGCAATVDRDGYVDCGGTGVDYDSICVRPALWINLES